MTLDNLVHLAAMSGGILYLMALLLLIALAVSIERFWALSRMLGQGKSWVRALKSHKHLDHQAVDALVKRDPASPFAQVAAVALTHDMNDPLDHFNAQLDEAVMDQAPRTDRGLWALDTIVTLAPLLGLLGTIIGMFNTFSALSNPGAQTHAVTAGVGEALVATAAGLFIAIVGLITFNALNQRVRLVMHQLDRIKVILMNRMYPHYREGGVRPVVVAQGGQAVRPTVQPSNMLQQKMA
ncbi:MotA/TolQ/ExbB proton channel family protein [Thiomonas bhubaneswarensis]|uniref:Outer membrane transport energization protein ExbB (TC 2.C.1.1.1) n=1 Tax=Thiomonas bhubaneswarensis TaxID=339866 RepID=A0A0K6I2F4_9BURK|nr:MotA/TolQ/ExbB proton channel family protein [Thiomonas bhubaneswarensis]CUA97261.1 outer membrane transport energization protein ExbB (TC 2.C.1.1.1) [Thiomonas bhubaneswarensis]